MRTLLITAIAIICSTVCTGQKTTVYRADVFNGYDNRNTTLSVTVDTDGRYCINSKYSDNDEFIGEVCIGMNRDEAVKTLKRMDYFVSSEDIVDMAILSESGILVEMFKTSETVFYEDGDELTSYDFFLTYITGEDGCFEIPDAFILLARRHI
jgi:hypothetical protein